MEIICQLCTMDGTPLIEDLSVWLYPTAGHFTGKYLLEGIDGESWHIFIDALNISHRPLTAHFNIES
jgi:hypothetical protein